MRLIAPGDPLLQRRDRESIVPDAAWRKKVWVGSGGAGVVLHDGQAVALWRGRKQGKTLEVSVEGTSPPRPCSSRRSDSRRTAAV